MPNIVGGFLCLRRSDYDGELTWLPPSTPQNTEYFGGCGGELEQFIMFQGIFFCGDY